MISLRRNCDGRPATTRRRGERLLMPSAISEPSFTTRGMMRSVMHGSHTGIMAENSVNTDPVSPRAVGA